MKLRIMLGSLALMASPVQADVKAGVDAWSRGSYAAAIKEWRPAAINGDADAQFNLGQAYKLGRGVPVDLKMAEDWYRKAALQGHVQAEDNYGLVLFQNGDRQRALPYVEKSAARGEPRAQYLLGTAFFNGDLVRKDWPRAYALMTRASAAGLTPASASLAQMDKYMPLDQRQRGLVLARELERTAVRQPVILPERPVAQPVPASVAIRTNTPPSRPRFDPPVTTPRPAPRIEASPRGGWRIQLGAFGDPGNARSLWGRLQGRLGGLQPYYVKAGPVTRLQAGPLANKAAAERACGAVRSGGQACLAVAP